MMYSPHYTYKHNQKKKHKQGPPDDVLNASCFIRHVRKRISADLGSEECK